jgi:hypothetical protein
MTEPAAARQTQLGATRLQGWRQRVLHLVALVGGWALFIWGWYDVSRQPWDSTALTWLVGASIVLLPLLTVAWILHNVGIYRRKGPRRGAHAVDDSYLHDWNGREISADLATVRSAPIVVIRIDGNRKIYTAAGAHPVPVSMMCVDAKGTVPAEPTRNGETADTRTA